MGRRAFQRRISAGRLKLVRDFVALGTVYKLFGARSGYLRTVVELKSSKWQRMQTASTANAV
jgi:hypothetical protein